MVAFLQRVAASTALSRIVLFLILVSSALVGLETYPDFAAGTRNGRWVILAQDVILWLFVVEIAIKMGAHWPRPWRYFASPWNVFDFVIVGVCFLPFGARFAAVFRMARLLRSVRMLTIVPELQVLVSALLRAIPSLAYVGLLLLLHFYIYAVLGTFTFAKNDPMRFGSLHASMMTLFQVLTLEGWNDVIDTQRLGSDVTYDEAWKQLAGPGRVSQAQPVIAAAYFVTFILMGTMIMLNLFTGVIISSMEDAQASIGRRLTMDEEEESEAPEPPHVATLREELARMAHEVHMIAQHVRSLEREPSDRPLPGAAPTRAEPPSDGALRG